MFSPMLPPGLMPETTRSTFSFSSVVKARIIGVGGAVSGEFAGRDLGRNRRAREA